MEIPEGFEWDDDKNRRNQKKHEIDFDDAKEVFDGPTLVYQSNHEGEERWVAIGLLKERPIAVIFTRRANVIRIISARRARKHEERAYRNAEVGRSPEGQD